MNKYLEKEIFLIINIRYLNIIKEIKGKLFKYDINVNIFRKDEDFKKLLSTDTIVILDKELLLDYRYLKHIESLIKMKRAIHIYKLPDVDISDLSFFFDIDNLNISNYLENNEDYLIKLILSLKTFQISYRTHYTNADKIYSKDSGFICLLEFYLKNKITDKNKLYELLPLSKNEFDYNYKLMEKLLINKMSIQQFSEMLPFIYHQVFKKTRYELKLNTVINEMYYEKEYLTLVLSDTSAQQLNEEYHMYLTAIKERTSINNTFTTILHKLGVIRIVDGEIRNILSEKDINKIKMFLETKFIKKETTEQLIFKDQIYLNYIDDFRIKNFIDFHKTNNLTITNNLNDADIIVTLITKKSLLNSEFINNIKDAVSLNKKLLFIYLDKCNLNVKLQYLIGFSDNMCYWAYNRIDIFFNKYLEKIKYISKNEVKEIKSNIIKLK